jgi:hypothetical protein
MICNIFTIVYNLKQEDLKQIAIYAKIQETGPLATLQFIN